MSSTLSEQLEEFRTGWMQRVPADRRAIMERHIAHLTETGFGERAKQVGDRAPAIVLSDAHGKSFDVATLLAKGPVVVTFYRGGWCPYCNLELKAYESLLPRIAAAGASMVAISPEKPDDTVSNAEKNGLSDPVARRSGSSMPSPRSCARPMRGSTSTFPPRTARPATGRCRCRRLMSSA